MFLGSKKISMISEYDDDLQNKDSNTLYLTETEVNLLKHINGKNTVKDIVELGLFTEYKIYKNLFNLFNKGLMKKREKTEIQEIQEKKIFEDLEHDNARKLDRLSQLLLLLLALLLLLTFFAPLRPFHEKNMLLKSQLYRDNLPSDPARALIPAMRLRRRLEKLGRPSAVAIGNFDGFHAGHRRIVETLAAVARRRRLASVVLTFHPHPRVFFHHPIQLISTDSQRLEILKRQPLDRLFFIDFAGVVDCPADDFVHDVLLKAPAHEGPGGRRGFPLRPRPRRRPGRARPPGGGGTLHRHPGARAWRSTAAG